MYQQTNYCYEIMQGTFQISVHSQAHYNAKITELEPNNSIQIICRKFEESAN